MSRIDEMIRSNPRMREAWQRAGGTTVVRPTPDEVRQYSPPTAAFVDKVALSLPTTVVRALLEQYLSAGVNGYARNQWRCGRAWYEDYIGAVDEAGPRPTIFGLPVYIDANMSIGIVLA